MELSNRIWKLMARSLSGEATTEEQNELSEFWNNNPAMLQQYELLRRMWDHHGHASPEEEQDYALAMVSKIMHLETEPKKDDDNVIADFEDGIRRRRRRVRRNAYMALGGVLVLALSGWLFTQRSTAQDEKVPKTIATQKGSRSKTLLPDGSTVWLNAGSKLEYINNFTGTTREIRLEGEAFFDIAKQKQPFIVHTAGIRIKVLGTSFNVRAYPEDKSVETTLYHGSVNISRENEPDKMPIILKPNEKLLMPKEAALEKTILSESSLPSAKNSIPGITILPIDSTKKENERFETAWIYSRLEFRGENFGELAPKLERWYNVSISFEDEKVKQLRFNGSFEKETLEEALVSLKIAIGSFKYKIKGNEVSVSSSQ